MNILRNFVLILFSIFFAAVGVYILIVAHESMWGLIIGAALTLLSPVLAIPAQMGPAFQLIVQYLPDSLVGGHRKSDPPAP